MKISVIVLTYNSAKTIRQALDSVLSQVCTHDFEIVASDDASTDETQEILKEYASRHKCIRLLCSNENRGLQANYYDCLETCNGEYIADCAGDDYWLGTSRLQLMADALDAHSDAGLVYTDWMKINVRDNSATLCRPALRHDCNKGELLPTLLAANGNPAVNLSAAMYRKSALMPAYRLRRDSLFRNKTYICEDMQLLAAIAAETSALYLAGPSLAYRVGHTGAITSAADKRKAVHFALASLRLRKQLGAIYNVKNSMFRYAESRLYSYALVLAVCSKDKTLILEVMDYSKAISHIRPTTRLRLLWLKLRMA